MKKTAFTFLLALLFCMQANAQGVIPGNSDLAMIFQSEPDGERDEVDDEGTAPVEVSVEPDRLANAGQHRNAHEGVYLVSLTVWLVEEYDIDVGPRLGLGPGVGAFYPFYPAMSRFAFRCCPALARRSVSTETSTGAVPSSSSALNICSVVRAAWPGGSC